MMRGWILGLFVLLAGPCLAGGFLYSQCGGYKVKNLGELAAALSKSKDSPLWEEMGKLKREFDPQVYDTEAALADIDRIILKALVATRDKNVLGLKACVPEILAMKEKWTGYVSMRRTYGPLCQIVMLARPVMGKEELLAVSGWLEELAKKPDYEPKAAPLLGACYRAFLGCALGRDAHVAAGLSEVRKFMAGLNGAGLYTALDLGVQMEVFYNLIQAAEIDGSLYGLKGKFGTEEDFYLRRMGLVLANCLDTSGKIMGRGFTKDSEYIPLCGFAMACRYGVSPLPLSMLCAIGPREALFYGTGARKATLLASKSLMFSPAGTGVLLSRSRAVSGPDSRFLRLVTVNGGRYGDILALALEGAGLGQMGIWTLNSPETVVGAGFYTHPVASGTVCINFERPNACAARIIEADNQGGRTFIVAEAKDAYPDMKEYRRTILMLDEYCLDLFSLASDKAFAADWVWPVTAKGVPVLTGATAPEGSFESRDIAKTLLGGAAKIPAYRLLEDIASQLATAQWSADFKNGIKTTMMGQGDTRILTAKCGGTAIRTGEITHYRKTDGACLVVRRLNVKETLFAALHEIYEKSPKMTSFVRLDVGEGLLVFEIVYGDYLDYVAINPTGEPKSFRLDKRHCMDITAAGYGFVRLEKEQRIVLDSCNAEMREEPLE